MEIGGGWERRSRSRRPLADRFQRGDSDLLSHDGDAMLAMTEALRTPTRRHVMFKPNFTGISRDGDDLVVSGESDPHDFADIVSIRVFLSQGANSDGSSVSFGKPNPSWTARFESATDFTAGPVSISGVEMRDINATTITWSQLLEIP
jgi:hypothetical protein